MLSCLYGNKFQLRINMKAELILLFKEFTDKQESIKKLAQSEKLNDYNHSEIHTIAAIGDLDEPNVTNISNYLNMTRGGISKITKKLISEGLITSEQRGDNLQKIFYNLTEKGIKLYEEHAKTHECRLNKDKDFLNKFDNEELKVISKFMKQFNEYLDTQISKS